MKTVSTMRFIPDQFGLSAASFSVGNRSYEMLIECRRISPAIRARPCLRPPQRFFVGLLTSRIMRTHPPEPDGFITSTIMINSTPVSMSCKDLIMHLSTPCNASMYSYSRNYPNLHRCGCHSLAEVASISLDEVIIGFGFLLLGFDDTIFGFDQAELQV